jgi:UDP-N-acetylmuramoyl-tripeptide--D-alanyl-D-alanine ligase
MSLWTAPDLRSATACELDSSLAVAGVSIDTRSLAPGDLFVALRDQRDGHDFVAEALRRGAAVAMVDHVPAGVPGDAPLLRVPDTLAGLAALGTAARTRSRARFAAVTGSVGKTGTKDMLRLLLGALGPTHAAVASYNNHWGVPLTLARLPRDAAFAVIEIGMNNPGEIAPLARMARPHVVGITAIGEAHIGHMGSLAAVAEEKGSIAVGLEPGGVAVLPRDGEFFLRLAEIARAPQGLPVAVVETIVRTAEEIEARLPDLAQVPGTGLVIGPESFVLPRLPALAAAARAQGLPGVSVYPRFAEVGGLMAYGPDVPDIFRRAAGYVDRILRGASPATLPVQQPERFAFTLNQATATTLGLTLPPALLAAADRVID